jgi:hypothetical protein
VQGQCRDEHQGTGYQRAGESVEQPVSPACPCPGWDHFLTHNLRS